MMCEFLLAVTLAASPAGEARDRDLLVECERFSDVGGWTLDAQFIDQMGSSYLLAHGLGNPVADATGRFQVPQGGRRDVYVRTKNWTAPWARTGAAGRFRIAVNGRELPETLGLQGNGDWQWIHAGAALLREGVNSVSLHDLTGFDARCDAIVLAIGARTPDELDRLAEQERRKGAVDESHCDFVVVGGGIAGICAAVSAARSGLRTALVHNRPVLGGNNSSEVRVHLGAYANLPPYPRLGDVLAEIAPARGGNAQPASNYQDERKLAVVRNERNLSLFLDTHVNEVFTNAGGRIAFVRGVNVKTGRRTDFHADLFADTTGDGTVGVLAGADYRVGREARSEYGEPSAPVMSDGMTMGASVQWYAERGGTSGYPVGPWMIAFDEKSARPGLRGDWDWETGLGRDQVREAERIRDYGMLVVYSNWSYLKNGFSRKAEFSDAALSWVSFVAGKRESRRLLGDYVLTECDLVGRNVQPDGTASATWTIDQHYPWGKEHTGFSGEPFQAESRNTLIWPYPIPYRCLYSRNVGNLFMAGRDISVTHAALGATRLMRTHGMLGEVVGLAAAVAKANGCSPREVLTGHWNELEQLLRAGAGDGKVHPLQTYNCQRSLDSRLMDKVQQRR